MKCERVITLQGTALPAALPAVTQILLPKHRCAGDAPGPSGEGFSSVHITYLTGSGEEGCFTSLAAMEYSQGACPLQKPLCSILPLWDSFHSLH